MQLKELEIEGKVTDDPIPVGKRNVESIPVGKKNQADMFKEIDEALDQSPKPTADEK